MNLSPRKLFWLTIFLAGLPSLALVIGNLVFYYQTGQPQHLALAIISGAVTLTYLVSGWLAHYRSHVQLALWLIISAQILGVVFTSFFLINFWLIGLLLLVAIPLEIGIAGNLQRMPLAIILALMGGVVMIFIDLLMPPDRLTFLVTIPQLFYFGIGLSVFYLLTLIFLLWYSRLRKSACCYVRLDLATQLSLIISAICALSIFIVTGVLILQILEGQIKEVGQNFQTMAEVEAERVGNILERQVIDLSNLGQAPDIINRVEKIGMGEQLANKEIIRSALIAQEKRWQDAEENGEFVLQFRTGLAVMALSAFRGNQNAHTNLFITDQLGRLVAAHGEKPEHFYYGDEEWWQSVWDLGQAGVYLGPAVNTSDPNSIFIAVRVINPKTYNPIEVLASTYNLQSIQQIIKLSNENNAQQIYLLADDGIVLAGPQTDIGQRITSALWADIQAEKSGVDGPPDFIHNDENDGESDWFLGQGDSILAYSSLNSTSQSNLKQLRGLGWTVLVTDTQNNALAKVGESVKIATMVALIVLACILILVNFSTKTITRPIKDLTATAQKIGEGNLELQAKLSGPQEVVSLANTFNDLTARLNEFIRSLRQSERKYRTLFEDSNDAIYLTDTTGHIVDVNPAGLKLFGYTEEEASHATVFDVYPDPKARAKFQSQMSEHGAVKDYELTLCKQDGTAIDCLLTATLRQTDNGKVAGYQGIIRDITAQKKAEKERLQLSAIQRELDVARSIQASLLPPAQPQWSGPDVVCYSKPAHEVGGDFYAYHALGGSTAVDGDPSAAGFALVVGDISGKGMPAALLMAVSLASLQTVINQAMSPKDLLAHLDQVMTHYTNTTRQNCALCYIELIPGHQVRELHVANAGCVPPMIRHKNGDIEWIDVGGMPLGVGLGMETGYQEVTLEISQGDLIILTSDGVIEAMNHADEMFGFEKFEQAVAAGPTTSAEAMLEYLKAEIATFVGPIEPHDDMTIVVVQV